jgi:hypothetical protein
MINMDKSKIINTSLSIANLTDTALIAGPILCGNVAFSRRLMAVSPMSFGSGSGWDTCVVVVTDHARCWQSVETFHLSHPWVSLSWNQSFHPIKTYCLSSQIKSLSFHPEGCNYISILVSKPDSSEPREADIIKIRGLDLYQTKIAGKLFYRKKFFVI